MNLSKLTTRNFLTMLMVGGMSLFMLTFMNSCQTCKKECCTNPVEETEEVKVNEVITDGDCLTTDKETAKGWIKNFDGYIQSLKKAGKKEYKLKGVESLAAIFEDDYSNCIWEQRKAQDPDGTLQVGFEAVYGLKDKHSSEDPREYVKMVIPINDKGTRITGDIVYYIDTDFTSFAIIDTSIGPVAVKRCPPYCD